jgi:hypothetical protein
MAIDLARLRSVMRGEITPKDGVTGVAGVATVARYASKSPQLRQLRPLRAKNTELEKDDFVGVADRVAAALPRSLFNLDGLQAAAEKRCRGAAKAGLTDRWCSCGKLATVAIGRFRPDMGNPEGVAQWLCQECFGEWKRQEAGAP